MANFPRARWALWFLITILLGMVSFLLRGTAVDTMANHAGGALYVVALIFLALCLAPAQAQFPARICVGAFCLTCAIEFLQLWHPPFLEAMRGTLPGRLILGNTFGWLDFPAYLVGSVLGFVVLRLRVR